MTRKAFVVRMRQGKPGGGKGPLISEETALTMGCANDQTLIQERDGLGCLNPWDSQTIRIYDGKADSFHAVNANSGGGQNREGIVMEEQLETKTDEIMCVHGSQDPITNDGDHANAVGRNQGAETAIAESVAKNNKQQGENNEHAKEARPSEILSTLRKAIGQEAFREWAAGRLRSIPSQEILRSEMHGSGVRCETEPDERRQNVSLPCEKTCPAWAVRDLRENLCLGCASQGSRLHEQRPEQPDADMQELPQQDPSRQEAVCHMRETPEGTWLLQQALGTIQKVREPSHGENKPILPRYTVRRLMVCEAERLMGFPDGHTIPCFKPEDITDELVDEFIEIFYEWDLMNMNSKKKKKEKSDAEEEAEDVEATAESDGGGDAEAEEEDEIEAETESETDDEGIEAEAAAETEETTEETGEPKKEKDEAPKLPKRRSRKVVRAWLLQISNPKTCPDGPRYKCAGNSFGVNCVRWIGLGIQAVEDKYAEEVK